MTNARSAKTTREKAAELRAEAAKAEARRRTMMITAAVAALIAVLVAGTILIKTASKNAADKATAAAAPPANLFDNGVLAGSPSTPKTLEIYEDFLCPACKHYEEANAAQIAAWAKDGTVKVVYRPVAILDDRTSPEGYSTRAANAAMVVQSVAPQQFSAYHAMLFANQPAEGSAGLTNAQLIDYAVKLGVDKAKIEADITANRYKGWVAKATEAFGTRTFDPPRKQVSTPTYVLDGKLIDNPDPALLKAAVEAK